MTPNTSKSNSRGFVRLFIVAIIIIGTFFALGLDPRELWEGTMYPILEFTFNVILKVIDFIFNIAIWFINKVTGLL